MRHNSCVRDDLALAGQTLLSRCDDTQVRELGDEINTLKATIPAAGAFFSRTRACHSGAFACTSLAASLTLSPLSPPTAAEGAAAAPTEAEKKVEELAKERKELVAGGFRDKHFNWGSLLLGLGVAISIEGAILGFACCASLKEITAGGPLRLSLDHRRLCSRSASCVSLRDSIASRPL